jgi:hypothetical protein
MVVTVLGIAAATLGAHDPISTKVTWEREIGPLVQARCVACHSPGGRAPMSLTTYEEARPWARAIREEVLTRRMPMWHVVRGYGDFSNDPSLSPFEVALFAAWADGGAPAFAKAPAGKPRALPKAPDLKVGPTRMTPPAVRPTDLPCTARTLPAGRVVGLKPVMGKGADLRVTITHADGTQEPILWLRGFDPRFAETYWLRTPIDVTGATRITTDGDAPCTLTVLFEAETAR